RCYDLIVCNPPYVDAETMTTLPTEYRHEPAIAFAGGQDGLAVVRRLLADVEPRLMGGAVRCL
ncbi:50S ribosomal protein L3 N(5)-glutamine methyltransferase, partial [Gammaproteobacteria bacterium]|nr:50S ribosomal protein L3 N(5)-glutamine methyltransferase [Gammaproteobacteria bacterium]